MTAQLRRQVRDSYWAAYRADRHPRRDFGVGVASMRDVVGPSISHAGVVPATEAARDEYWVVADICFKQNQVGCQDAGAFQVFTRRGLGNPFHYLGFAPCRIPARLADRWYPHHQYPMGARCASAGAAEVRQNVRVWQQYDEWGEHYLDHAATGTYNAFYDRPAVLGLVGDVAGKRVLDAGCGPGLYSDELLRLGADVTAIDGSEEQIRIARKRLGERARIQRAVLGERLPFEDAAFDLVVCALVMHYLRDQATAYAEFRRVLRPGGRAIVSTHHPMADWLRKGGDSYFDVCEQEDVWTTPHGPQPMRYWRAPLTHLCAAATSSGLLISRVVEPLPQPEMKDQDPKDWMQLNREPAFIILEVVKPGAP